MDGTVRPVRTGAPAGHVIEMQEPGYEPEGLPITASARRVHRNIDKR